MYKKLEDIQQNFMYFQEANYQLNKSMMFLLPMDSYIETYISLYGDGIETMG